MSKTDDVPSQVRALREARGLTQDELARASGLSRQSIGSIEAGRSIPAVDVALRLSSALGASVEALFGAGVGASTIEAEGRLAVGARVVLAELRGRWVAHEAPLDGATSADGIVRARGRAGVTVEPTRPLGELRDTLLVAGCALGLGLTVARLGAGVRAVWLACSSTEALEALSGERVHVAAIHRSARGASTSLPAAEGAHALVRFASWEAGLVVPAGNPRRIRGAADLDRRGLRVVTREHGAGARRLLDRELERAGVTLSHALEARGHREVAMLVALGAADAGIATRDVAIARGLGFVTLAEERIDLVLGRASLADPRVARLLDAVRSRGARRELEALGYDTRQSGSVLAEERA